MFGISNVCGTVRNAVQRRRHSLYYGNHRKCNAGKVETKRGLKCMKKCENRETYSETKQQRNRKKRAKEGERETTLISADSRTSLACWLSVTWAWAQISQTTPLKFSMASL